jgi:predicted secreted protein
VVLCTGVCGLWAGDTASFVDLGFSPDGKTYMFAQSGTGSITASRASPSIALGTNPAGAFGTAPPDQVLAGQTSPKQIQPEPASIEFRDFESGASYRASLVSSVDGSGRSLKSSFNINLERTARDGSKKVYTVGTPQLKRPLIASYCIKKLMIAPHDGSMIMVIEMKKQDGGNIDIRFKGLN